MNVMAMERKGKMVADGRNCRLVTFTFYFKAYALCIMLRTISSCLKPPDSSHYDVPLPLISSSQVLAVMQEFVSSRMVKNGVCNKDKYTLYNQLIMQLFKVYLEAARKSFHYHE